MDNPLVSIGIPIYNVELYIEKCLNSVFAQTYMNLEVLAIDDCGQDKSMDIVYDLHKTHPRGAILKIIKHEFNKGLGKARNTAINNASGK